jgi:hypothetical protein
MSRIFGGSKNPRHAFPPPAPPPAGEKKKEYFRQRGMTANGEEKKNIPDGKE